MNKKAYTHPTVEIMDFAVEGMIATSVDIYDENMGEEFTQGKEETMWEKGNSWE